MNSLNSLSLFSLERVLFLLSFLCPSSGFSPIVPCVPHAGDPRDGHNIAGIVIRSRWDLRRAEWRESISFLILLTMYLLKQTRKHLTFWTVSAYCRFMLSFTSTNAPKSFCSGRSYYFTSMLVSNRLDQCFLPELLFYVSKENRDLCSFKKPRKKTDVSNILLFYNIYLVYSIYA